MLNTIQQEKLDTRFNKVSWWALWIGDPRNFHNVFFVKNFYLNLNFFQVLHGALLKQTNKQTNKQANKQKSEKDASHLKIAWHSKRQKNKI